LINIIAQDNSIIPYRKELNKITGCVTASILLSQLLYWCKKSGGEFYKFKEPCKHEKYTEGDSWCEELGFTRKQFDTAFMKLETAGFAMKRTTMDRVSFYAVDECTLSKALNSLYVKPESDFTKSTKGTLDIYTETTPETTPEKKKSALSDELFEKIWIAYDYKKNKQDSIKAFKKLKESDIDDIRKHLPKYVIETNTNGVYPTRAYLSTYFNKRRWEDEVTPTTGGIIKPTGQDDGSWMND